jgi:hypothetical protein
MTPLYYRLLFRMADGDVTVSRRNIKYTPQAKSLTSYKSIPQCNQKLHEFRSAAFFRQAMLYVILPRISERKVDRTSCSTSSTVQ